MVNSPTPKWDLIGFDPRPSDEWVVQIFEGHESPCWTSRRPFIGPKGQHRGCRVGTGLAARSSRGLLYSNGVARRILTSPVCHLTPQKETPSLCRRARPLIVLSSLSRAALQRIQEFEKLREAAGSATSSTHRIPFSRWPDETPDDRCHPDRLWPLLSRSRGRSPKARK